MENHYNTVLIIEDDAGLVELMSEKVAENGLQHKCFTNAKNAINWLKGNSPLIMLLDYGLPEMTGSEFISDLKLLGLSVPPFVVATGRGDERVAVEMMKLGARDYIIKDSNFLELMSLVISRVCAEIESENKLKLAEKEVKKISRHYQAIIEKSPDGCVLIGPDGHFKYASPSALRMFGYNSDNLLLLHPDDITHPEDLPMVLTNLGRLMENTTYVPVLEYRFKHSNGTWIWIESTFSNLLNDDAVNAIVINFRDISERKLAEETLKLRETYLTAIIENLPGIIWLKDAESHILLSNTKFAHTFGSEKPEDLLGKTDLDFSPKEHAERYLADDRKVVTTKKPFHVEELIYDQNSIKWFETFKMPIFDEHNVVIGTAGYAQDISERKEVEKTLKESEEKFKKAFMTSPDSININRLDDGLYISINKGFTTIMGYTEEDVFGKTSTEINIWVNPADRQKLVDGLRKKGIVENLVTQFRAKNGEIVYGMMSASVIELNGIQHILSITRNITEIKQAEEKLKKSEILHRTILQTAINGFWMADMTGKILDVNESYSRMSGYSVEELLNMNISEVEVNESGSDIQAHILRIKELNFDRFETKHRRKDGSIYDVEVSIQYKGGENEMMVSFIRDITVRKEAENALKESKITLNKLLFSSSEFIDSTIKGVDYSKMTNTMLEISGAKYASFNIFDLKTNDFTTVAMSGLKDIELKAVSLLGFSPINKVWKNDAIRAEKIKNSVITTFNSFNELSGHVLSGKIAKLIEKTFNVGKVVVVKIIKGNVAIGDFTLLFDRQSTLKNTEIVELFASQVGLYIVRNQVEEDLRESERKYRILFAENPQPMLVYDLETLKIFEVNKTAELFYGYNRGEFLKMTIDQLHSEEEKQYVQEMIQKTKEGINSDYIFNHLKKNGEKIFVETNTVSAPTFGQNARHVLIKDVTERLKADESLRASENRYKTFINATPDLVFIKDEKLKHVVVNKSLCEFYHKPENEILGKSDSDIINDVTLAENCRKSDEQALILNDTVVSEEQIKNQIFETIKFPIEYQNGKIGVGGYIRDITDRKEAEKALKEKMDEMLRFQKLTVGRELAMIELKKEINKLLNETGFDEKYKIV